MNTALEIVVIRYELNRRILINLKFHYIKKFYLHSLRYKCNAQLNGYLKSIKILTFIYKSADINHIGYEKYH